MPYDEFKQQAEQYYDIAKQQIEEGNKREAELNLNMAKNIANKNGMTDFAKLVQDTKDDL